MANEFQEWVNGSVAKSEKAIEKEQHKMQTNNIIVEDMVMNNFYIDAELDKIIDKLISNSKEIEHIIPRMMLDSFINNIHVHHNKNKKLLIKLWKNN